VYNKAEIGRRMKISRERVRQILDNLDTMNPYLSDEFDWETLGKIRKMLRIRFMGHVHKEMEYGMGKYKYPKVTTAAVKYFAYVLDQVMIKLDKLEKLVKELKIPYDE